MWWVVVRRFQRNPFDEYHRVFQAMTDTKSVAIDLEKLLAGAQLAALPQSAIRLLELSQDPTNGPADFAVPIESDPGLAGQVLRLCVCQDLWPGTLWLSWLMIYLNPNNPHFVSFGHQMANRLMKPLS